MFLAVSAKPDGMKMRTGCCGGLLRRLRGIGGQVLELCVFDVAVCRLLGFFRFFAGARLRPLRLLVVARYVPESSNDHAVDEDEHQRECQKSQETEHHTHFLLTGL
jgi:hypothetical protein